jgi:hypothetical protein
VPFDGWHYFSEGSISAFGSNRAKGSDGNPSEISHVVFLTAYLKSKGHKASDPNNFANLETIAVPGVPETGQLANFLA